MIEPDELLAWRAGRGDREAWEILYRRYVDRVWSRLQRLVGPDAEREDLVQQIFLEVFEGLAAFRGEAAFSTYLYRVQINIVYDHLKRRGRRPLTLPDEMYHSLQNLDPTPEQSAQSRERLSLIWAALVRMKPKKRIALVLAVSEGLTLDEIARLVRTSANTVAKRIEHARKELRSALKTGGLP